MKKTIIYIAGYGRSGSTLLDVIFGSHAHITGVGELANIFDCIADPESVCSCGEKIRSCPFWGKITEHLCSRRKADNAHQDKIIQTDCEDWKNFTLLFNIKNKKYDKYRTLITNLFDYIFKISGREFIVDSSKNAYTTAWRPLALKKICGYDVKIIHLLRSGKGVMNSKLKGDNTDMRKGIYRKKPLAAYEGLVGWIFSNIIVIITRMLLPSGSYHLMTYEDLVKDPETELTKVGGFIGLDVRETLHLIRKKEPITVGHLISGNRLAFNSSSIVINKDSAGKVSLPIHLNILYYLTGWPVMMYTRLHNFAKR